MGYKDIDKRREAERERQRRYRAGRDKEQEKGVTTEGVTEQGVTYPDDQAELKARGLLWCDILGDRVRRPWFVDGTGWTIQEAPRYLTLSDGQVLDRANQPQPNRILPEMMRANRAAAQNLAKEVSPALRRKLAELVKV